MFQLVLDYMGQLKKEGLEVSEYPKFQIFEIGMPQITEGKVILDVLKELNILTENSIAFGDSYNYIEMLESVGYGCAMENGCDSIKEVANQVVESCIDQGVVKELQRLGLVFGIIE